MRLSATALDTTGADTNTQVETVDFYVVVYQIFTYALVLLQFKANDLDCANDGGSAKFTNVTGCL